MLLILKYVIIYPIMYVIDWLDYLLDAAFVRARSELKMSGCPARDSKHTIPVEIKPTSIAYRSARFATKLFCVTDDEPELNVYEAVRRSASQRADRRAMGTREVVGIDDQVQADGKTIRKFIMKNEYSWITFGQMIERVDHLANGFLHLGLRSNDNVVIFSETRAEWMLCALACFKIKVPMVTLYATLGNFKIFVWIKIEKNDLIFLKVWMLWSMV